MFFNFLLFFRILRAGSVKERSLLGRPPWNSSTARFRFCRSSSQKQRSTNSPDFMQYHVRDTWLDGHSSVMESLLVLLLCRYEPFGS